MARQRKNANTNNSNSASNNVNESSSSSSSKKIESNRHLSTAHNGTSSSSAGSQTPINNSKSASSSTTSVNGNGSNVGRKISKKITNLIMNNNRFFIMTQWRMIFGCSCLVIASYFCYLGYLETRVNTPFDNQKMVQRTGLNDPEKYWGSYRPGTYFGLKTRDPYSLVMGLMWYVHNKYNPNGEGIRHWCEIGDNLKKYGWLLHDGKTFGYQKIHDSSLILETSFIKIPGKQFGGDWSARISVKNTQNLAEKIALIWYTAFDEKTEGEMRPETREKPISGIYGETLGLGEFRLTFHGSNGTLLHSSYLSTVAPSLQYLRETITSFLRIKNFGHKFDKFLTLPGEALISQTGQKMKANFIANQIIVETPFTLDVSYQSTSGFSVNEDIPKPPIGDAYTDLLNTKMSEFNEKFEKIFDLTGKGYSKDEIIFAKSALSNMIGGIGYFYGSSRVQSVYTKEPVPYWKAPLYTAVPSRSFFPRGFLWDEGFHGLLITEWDIDLELDIICHWFDLMNVEGWIPREQILGVEALAKVPEEFVTQKNTNANPPTFFLTLKKIITKYRSKLSAKGRIQTLERIFPRLQAWFSWYNTTQKGELIGTYRWRGRDEKSQRELNPKTLTSGLDDYPRASHPNDKERHVDLRCWIAFAAGVMADLAQILGREDTKYWETFSYLSDNSLLNELHLSPYTETYSDWGLHTDSVILKRPKPTKEQRARYQQPEMIRVTLKQPELRFIDSTFGYVSLFPFLLEILDPQSPYLLKILKDMRDPNILWTNYGLRSLSKTSPMYMKRNTEHDPPYWRGQIWININYLALKALHHYAKQPGPYSEDSKRIYVELRQNLVKNIYKEYKRTGYIWEQYNDKTGEGSGCYPFTGWSGLVVLIMSEKY